MNKQKHNHRHYLLTDMRNIFVDGVTLNRNDWYMRLLHWMYGTKPDKYKSLCPLFWSVVGSLLILPIYLLMLGFVNLVVRTYKYKFGEIILDTIGYIAKWIFCLAVLLLMVFILSCMISGIITWWMYGIVQEASIIVLIILGIMVLVTFFAYIMIQFDSKPKTSKTYVSTIENSYTDSNVKRVTKHITKPFRMFGLFIVATYHKICPMITWK